MLFQIKLFYFVQDKVEINFTLLLTILFIIAHSTVTNYSL